MITLNNFKIQLEVPALDRIAKALEKIGKQMKAQHLTQESIEEHLLNISSHLEEISMELEHEGDEEGTASYLSR